MAVFHSVGLDDLSKRLWREITVVQFNNEERAIISHAMAPVPLALIRILMAEAPRQRDLIREGAALGRRAGICRIAEAIAGPDRSGRTRRTGRVPLHRSRLRPHQMRALLGYATADLDVALDDRIAIAIDALIAAGLISTWHDGG